MNALKLFIILSVIFAALILGAMWGLKIERAIMKEESRVNLTSTENLLTQWVYSKSEKISIDTARLIVKEAKKTEHTLLILSLVSAESEFSPTATSKKDAIGLTQVRWSIHSKALIEAGIAGERRDLYNVGTSMRAGNFILNNILRQTRGNVQRALELYLGGKDGAYVRRVLGNLADLYVLTEVTE